MQISGAPHSSRRLSSRFLATSCGRAKHKGCLKHFKPSRRCHPCPLRHHRARNPPWVGGLCHLWGRWPHAEKPVSSFRPPWLCYLLNAFYFHRTGMTSRQQYHLFVFTQCFACIPWKQQLFLVYDVILGLESNLAHTSWSSLCKCTLPQLS